MDEAWEALRAAMALMEDAAGNVEAVEEAIQAAAKYDGRSEPLTELVAVARTLIEQARAAEAERAKVAAEEAAAAAAVEAAAEVVAAAERLQIEQEMAALTLRLQQLGVPPAAPAPHRDVEETQCVVCMDAAKDLAVRPCMHVCVCETCAQLLMLERTPRCPVCREPIQHIERVFFWL
jgi:hypothetical protein